MQKQWFVLSEKFSKLTNREQYIVLFAGVIILFLLFNALMFDSNEQKTKRVNRSITQIASDNSKLTLESAKAQVQMAKNPNDVLQKSIAAYKAKLSSVDNVLYSLTNELISPTQMREALQQMLSANDKVKITSFTSLPAESLIKKSSTTEPVNDLDENPQIDLYRHSIHITLQGDYFQLRDYLKSIEQLSWSFYWHQFDYKVDTYPQAQLKIEMYSLSTKKEFIGV